MATRCHPPPGTFCIVSVIAGQQRWQGSRVQTPSRHFFFFRLDLPARPALSVILPWLLHAGPCGLVDKALVSEPKIAGSSPARIKFFLVPYAAPASLDPMMLLLSARPRSA